MQRNKSTEAKSKKGFWRIRRGLYNHVADGNITGPELMVYVAIHMHADYETGVAMKMSAPYLARFLGVTDSFVGRKLRSLEKKGYIKRLGHRGQVRHYPVIINKYLTSKGMLIDADNSLSVNEIAAYTEQDCILSVFKRNVKCTARESQVFTILELKNLTIPNPETENITEQTQEDDFGVDGKKSSLLDLDLRIKTARTDYLKTLSECFTLNTSEANVFLQITTHLQQLCEDTETPKYFYQAREDLLKANTTLGIKSRKAFYVQIAKDKYGYKPHGKLIKKGNDNEQ